MDIPVELHTNIDITVAPMVDIMIKDCVGLQGHIIYPGGINRYFLVSVYDWYDPSEYTVPKDRDELFDEWRGVPEAYGQVERAVSDCMCVNSTDDIVQIARRLWGETELPVCLYLDLDRKIIFDDFWEGVVVYGNNTEKIAIETLEYLQYDPEEMIVISSGDDEIVTSSIGKMRGRGRVVPQEGLDVPAHVWIPKAALEVWRNSAGDDSPIYGFDYIAGHPVVKASIRAFFDLARTVHVKHVFDLGDGGVPTRAWHRRLTGTVNMNYGMFAPEYIMGVMGIGSRDATDVIDGFTRDMIHEIAHSAEWCTGFPYDGSWCGVDSEDGTPRKDTPIGSELIAVAVEQVGLRAILEHDVDHVRSHVCSAIGCQGALADIWGSRAFEEFRHLIDTVTKRCDVIVEVVEGVYVPTRGFPSLRYHMRFMCPLGTWDEFVTAMANSGFSLLQVGDVQYSVKWQRFIVDYEIEIPADDQGWIKRAFVEYPDRYGIRNEWAW
ncbi:MAG: hypothetical protein WCQ69_09510 [Bacteroidales bacterium]